MSRPSQPSGGFSLPPGEELGRLIEMEQRLAARVEAARREAGDLIARARAEADSAASEAEARIGAATREVDERLRAEYAARRRDTEEQGSRQAAIFASATDAQVKALAQFAIARLLEVPPEAPR
jgi:vacuolar-type H+-ATPase subunit H